MNIRAWSIALACAAAVNAAPANALEVVDNSVVAKPANVVTAAAQPDLTALQRPTMLNSSELSELPEPEVIAMMLVGLILIGYRASRDSSEKFE